MEKKTVGIVGLGFMGSGIASNLIESGYHVVCADISEDACGRVRELGGEIVSGAAQVGEKCRHILISLSSEKALRSVLNDLSETCAPGSIVIETGTFSIEDKENGRELLAKKGITMLDVPLSGSNSNKNIGFNAMASGDQKAIDEISYVLDGFCRKWENVGEFGTGAKLKLVANHQTCIQAAGVAEALYFAHKLGLDLHKTVKILEQGAGSCPCLTLHGPKIARRAWEETTNRVMKNFKDQRITCELLGNLDCPAPMYKAAVVLTKRTAELGHEDHDRGAIFEVLERMDNERLPLSGVDAKVDKNTI